MKITITLSDNSGFLSSTWKVTPSVTDNRTLNFAQSSYTLPYESKTYVSLICNPGTLADYGLTYTLSQNLVNAGVTFDSNAMELCQSQKLSNDVTGTLTATSWDGRKTATTTVVAKKPAGEVVIIITPEVDETGMDEGEKSQSSENNILMSMPEANSVTVSLVKRVEGSPDEVITEGVTNVTITSEDPSYITAEKTSNYKARLTGIKATPAATKAAISGPVHIRATATYQGQTIQSKDSEANAISVTDNRDAEWGSKTATIYNDGVAKSTTLTANFSGQVTIDPGNVSGFSWSENNSTWKTGPDQINVSRKVAKTIYYKYTGSEETTKKIEVKYSEGQKYRDINIIPKLYSIITKVPNKIGVNQTDFIKADLYLDGEPIMYDVAASWNFGSKINLNNENRTINGRTVGIENYTCTYILKEITLQNDGQIEVNDLRLSFTRESHWDEDIREYNGTDWSIDCNSAYKLINVEVAVCGWDKKNEDAEYSNIFFSSTNPNATKYGWKNVQTSQLSTFVPTQWIDEENDVEEIRAEVTEMGLTPYFRVYVTYRLSTDSNGSYRSQEMIYDTWPN